MDDGGSAFETGGVRVWPHVGAVRDRAQDASDPATSPALPSGGWTRRRSGRWTRRSMVHMEPSKDLSLETEVNIQQQRALFAFRRTTNFVDVRPQLTTLGVPEGKALANQVEALKGVTTRLAAHGTDQLTLASSATLVSKDEGKLRQDLIDHHIRTIASMARGLNGTVPGIGVLTMPKGTLGKAQLIEAATSFARKAEIYQDVLVQHGLPVDVIGQLDAAIDAFRGSIDARGTSRTDLKGATRGVTAEIALGRKITAMLDAIVSRQLRGQPDQQEVWRAAKRVGGSSKGTQVLVTADQRSVGADQGKADAARQAA